MFDDFLYIFLIGAIQGSDTQKKAELYTGFLSVTHETN